MPESILIVDDAPINRKLTQRVLAGAGYEVRTVEDADEALDVIVKAHPSIVLTDIRLRGSDSLGLVRRIKQDPGMQGTLVIALTACVAEDDRRRALDAGCDDYLVKPIDTRTFPDLIRAHLAGQKPFTAPVPPALVPAGPPAWLEDWRGHFLRNGSLLIENLLASRAGDSFDRDIREAAHIWAGLGQTFGYPEVTTLARRLEELAGRPGAHRNGDLEAVLRGLLSLFDRLLPPGAGPAADVRSAVGPFLSGKRFVLDSLGPRDTARVLEALEYAGGDVLDPDPAAFRECDLVIASTDSPRLNRHSADGVKPILLVAATLTAPQCELLLKAVEWEFVLPPWTREELLARACRALGRWPRHDAGPGPASNRKPSVLVADDDSTTLMLLKTTIESDGLDCAVASEGDQALAMIRAAPPDVAVLEAIMPNMDGFEVLAAVRNQKALKHVRVMLLTSLQQESDIVRGFALGADDYVTKPFSPVEVVARIRRLVRSEP